MIDRLERGVAIGAATALVLLVVVVVVDVVGRNVFNSPLASGTELTELLMAAMVFLSFPLLAWRQRDITVDLFDFLAGSPALRKFQVALAGLVGAIVFALLARQLVVFAQRAAASGESTAQLQIPLAYVWWVMCALSAVTALASLIVAIAVFTRQPIPPEVHARID